MNILLSAQAAQQGGGGFSLLIMMVLILVVMWLFMIRPQQKRQKQIRNFQNALKEGDAVVTGGGIYGTVKHIDPATGKIKVEIARGVEITVNKGFLYAGPTEMQQQ